MHPRIHSHPDSRAISPTAALGVTMGNPRFAGTAARTAHSPSADAEVDSVTAEPEQAAPASRQPPFAAQGPGAPGGPQGDVEAGGNISDSVDEAAGRDGSNAPSEPPPADASAQGGDA